MANGPPGPGACARHRIRDACRLPGAADGHADESGPRLRGIGQNPESLADIAHIDRLWASTREQYGAGGPYLFGETFNVADAMFAPVVARFLTFAPPLSASAKTYCDAVRAHKLVSLWYAQAAEEPASWQLEKYESLA